MWEVEQWHLLQGAGALPCPDSFPRLHRAGVGKIWGARGRRRRLPSRVPHRPPPQKTRTLSLFQLQSEKISKAVRLEVLGGRARILAAPLPRRWLREAMCRHRQRATRVHPDLLSCPYSSSSNCNNNSSSNSHPISRSQELRVAHGQSQFQCPLRSGPLSRCSAAEAAAVGVA